MVLRSNQLEVYTARMFGSAAAAATAPAIPAAAAAGSTGGGSEAGMSLELLSSCQLFGVAESVAVLRGRAPGQRDALLLTFRQVFAFDVVQDGGCRVAGHAAAHCLP